MASHILVVDDESMVRALIAPVLSDAGSQRLGQDFPYLPILHSDISRKRMDMLPEDVPTVYNPFSSAALREAVPHLLGG